MPALGEEFRSAREARGLSLSDVAERLHIRSVYLAAIEDEDWKAIGAPVYVRGFMRTYARFLGLDSEAAVARFSAGAGGSAATATRAEERPVDRDRGSGEGRRPSAVSVLAIVVAVAVVSYVAYAYIEYRTGAVPVARETAAPASSEPVAQVSAAPTATASAGPPKAGAAVRPAGNHQLSVRLTAVSWLRVMIDGAVVAEGTYPAGTAKTFNGKNVADVRVGNAGGVQVAVNGRSIGPLGASGDVVERRFVLSGE